MTTKKSERIRIADEAIKAKKNGIAFVEIAERYDVGYHTMLNWVKLRKSGGLIEDIPKDTLSTVSTDDIPTDLMGTIKDEFKQLGALETETVEMMVFIGEIKDKNFLVITVENPDITDPDEYDSELKKRIWSKLGAEAKYGFAATGFKLMEEKSES